MSTEPDETEEIRRARLVAINHAVASQDTEAERKRMQAQCGQVWDSAQLVNEFEVLGFMAPYVVYGRRSDGRKGSLEVQHHPRLYFKFVLDTP